MNARPTLIASAGAAGTRLDVYLAQELNALSRSRARELILAGYVMVDGRMARPSQRVAGGQSISVRFSPPTPMALTPEAMDLTVAYEDADVLVVDKPAGLAVHPAPGHAEHTLVHGLLARGNDLSGIGGVLRPGIVHRLDLQTSGLLAVAKSERGHAALSAQFAARTVKKGYLALLCGRPANLQGLIDAPIGRDPVHRQRMAVVARGRSAQTRYLALATPAELTFVLAMPLTGRTHQIRVHFASIGHPIAGDSVYGRESDLLDRQFLHAAMLRFERPSDGGKVELFSPLPADLHGALQAVLLLGTQSSVRGQQRIHEMIELGREHFQTE